MSPDPEATIVFSAEPSGPASGVPGGGANPDAKVDYLFGSEIARGGMGSILRAEDCKLPRTVAVKIILSEINADAEQKQRFINEAAVLAQLAHPNIVPVYDIGRDPAGQLFYSMKLVKGRTLQAILNDLRAEAPDAAQHYTLDRLLTIFRKVCDALAFAHSHGIIHRDLKPENVMVGEFGEVLVMDWGLAKRVGGERSLGTGDRNQADGTPSLPPDPCPLLPSAATLAGTVMGTPQYMSPEQAMGQVTDMDARSDIFSLGGILYAILTLRPPFEGATVREILEKVRKGEIAPLECAGPPALLDGAQRRGGLDDPPQRHGDPAAAPPPSAKRQRAGALQNGRAIPESLAAVAMKALTVDKAQRYQDVAAFSADVEAYQGGFATSAENAGVVKQLALLIKRHKGLFGTAAAAWLIITALAVWFVMSVTRERNRATANEQKATRNAEIAQANEKRAEDKEREAVAEKENVRRALAESALALAEAAYREANGPAMQAALDRVPSDLRDASWSYLLEESDMSIGKLPSLGYRIRSAAANPTQPSVFALAGEKSQITVVNVRTGERLLEFPVELKSKSGYPLHIAFSPDGERIAVGKSDGATNDPTTPAIAVHSAHDGAKLAMWTASGVASLKFSPDGRHLLQLNRDKKQALILWDSSNGQQVWNYQPDRATPLRGDFMPDGRHLLVSSGYAIRFLLKLEDGTEERELMPDVDIGVSTTLAVQHDGSAFLQGGADGDVFCGDAKTGRLLFSIHAHPSAVRNVAFTPDDKRFVSMSRLVDGRLSLVVSDARNGRPLRSLIGGSGEAEELSIHPLSGEMLTLGTTGRVWDITGTPARWTFPTFRGDLRLGGAVFWGSDDLFLGPVKGGQTALLDLRDLSERWRVTAATSYMPSVSADGRTAAIGIAYGIQAFRREGDQFVPQGTFASPGVRRALRVSPSGERFVLITTGSNRPAQIIDSATGSLAVAPDTKTLQEINDVQWLADNAHFIGIATANKARGVEKSEEHIIVWDAASGKQVRSIVHPTALDCLVVAPDGKSFAAAGADKLVHVFDTETLAERQAFRAHDGPITALAWHPARPIVATASEDLTIKLWNLDTGRRLETLRGPTAAPRVLTFSPSGQRLACASEDRMVRIWEPPSLNNAMLDVPKTDGWEDLLAKLKADDVKANGNGWTLSSGVLMSPAKSQASLPLPGNYARNSYQVRMKLRRLNPKNSFGVILPVADQQVSFVLDGYESEGFASGLQLVDGKGATNDTNGVKGQQIKDTEPHELAISVRISARTAHITATLDERPLYEWTGPATSLSLSQKNWPTLPQPNLYLGTSTADWVVSAVKVKRLEK